VRDFSPRCPARIGYEILIHRSLGQKTFVLNLLWEMAGILRKVTAINAAKSVRGALGSHDQNISFDTLRTDNGAIGRKRNRSGLDDAAKRGAKTEAVRELRLVSIKTDRKLKMQETPSMAPRKNQGNWSCHLSDAGKSGTQQKH